ncbi:MAG TPA: sn-glycerol-3-phosphate ABC transporter ATP-binding protein UgpC [Gaiellales bacterium]|jgi:multiple sugar transport system ATP-binding protein|nr:sn-glycerol-3-phosphate ABC transporter ATP-binding protein UgpC [Gaiellales bacterium]
MARILLDHVKKVFAGGVVAVNDVSLEIGDGEFMVLVGPSGCGKSTLLRIVAGLEEVTDGEVVIGDRVVTDEPPKRRDIAMVFQNYALYPHMTVAQNLGIGLKIQRRPKKEIGSKVMEVAQVLGLDQLLDRKPAALSGGQRQRVAMGRAMVREPQAFLMDEPLSNLDAKLRVQMRGELARLRDRLHTTTIYVTHDQIEAMTLGDRVAVMRDGVVQQLDTPNALYQRPANLFVGAFIGSPSMNLVEARVEGREVCFAEYRLPIADQHDLRAYDGRSVVLGMRPSDFEDATVWRDESRATMRVRVDVVEELGSQVNLLFTVAAHSGAGDVIAEVAEDAGDSLPVPLVAAEGTCICTACVNAASPAEAGGEAEVSVDPALFHYFDPDTGVAVGTATTAATTA